MIVDHINGCFEGLGACFNAWNCYCLFRDKKVRGTSVGASAFFTSWGVWNLAYYPILSQWWSFAGGCALSTFSLTWLILAITYLRREGKFKWSLFRRQIKSSVTSLIAARFPRGRRSISA